MTRSCCKIARLLAHHAQTGQRPYHQYRFSVLSPDLSSHQTGLTCGVYAATKFGVRTISETLREEEAAAHSNIRVTMLAPGMVATELPQSLTTREGRDGTQAAYDALAIPAQSVAESIAFAFNMPEHTSINEIIIRPTAQQL